ncbi:CAP family protein [Phytomonospora endophytica]|uniref:Uncharacterized protein YkwD n=1 Tax=Phytomonospora endophytica TaxID=714109 RepID=A0A841FW72_9ACTN|nr:CAP family protein [Phytomonospora endophytica]MBB6039003.1 uncharacterized protein YkwD [Phytomonospora endophytica]GIG69483.1 serine protease [Phytomonospora endophytica]
MKIRIAAVAAAAGLAALATAAPSYATDTAPTPATFAADVLDAHNAYRDRHGAPHLAHDAELGAKAEDVAGELAASGDLSADAAAQLADGLGVNLAWTNGGDLDGHAIVETWYDQITAYDFDEPGYSEQTGSFTQVVWRDSTGLGTGYAELDGGGWLVVTLYSPAGNVDGEFEGNVARP